MSDVSIGLNVKADTSEAESKLSSFVQKVREGFRHIGGGGASAGGKKTDAEKDLASEMKGLTAVIHGAGRGIANAAKSGGNLLPATGGLMEDLASVGGKVGAAGAVLLGAAAVAAGVNALSEQYEKVVPSLMKQTARFGELGGTSDQNHDAMVSAMHRVSAAASKFGYSLEEGTNALNAYTDAGISRKESMAKTDQVFGYARSFGVDPNETANFDATGQRFGMNGNLLGQAAGALEQSGMKPGQYKEFLDATLSVFEDGLSRGIVRGFGDIEKSQILFSQAGDTFKGQYGAQQISKMSSSIAGATALGSESNALVYQAARGIVGANGKYGDFTDAMRQVEKGATAENFEAIMKRIDLGGGDHADKTLHVMQAFGVNYTNAEKLMNIPKDKNGKYKVTDAEVKDLTTTKSPEQDLLRVSEETRDSLRGIGSGAMLAKLVFLEGINASVGAMAVLLGAKFGSGSGVLRDAGLDPNNKNWSSRLDPIVSKMTPEQLKAYTEKMSIFSNYGTAGAALAKSDYMGKGPFDEYLAQAVLSGDKDGIQVAEQYARGLGRPGTGAGWARSQSLRPDKYEDPVKRIQGLDSRTFNDLSAKERVQIAESMQKNAKGGALTALPLEQLIASIKDNVDALRDLHAAYRATHNGADFVDPPGLPVVPGSSARGAGPGSLPGRS